MDPVLVFSIFVKNEDFHISPVFSRTNNFNVQIFVYPSNLI